MRAHVSPRLSLAVALALLLASSTAADPAFASRAQQPPRKVVIASVLADIAGTVEQRLQTIEHVAASATAQARERSLAGVDLLVLPEFALSRESGRSAAARAVRLEGVVRQRLAALAREQAAWLLVPMTLEEAAPRDGFSNAAVLFDRRGEVAGIYRKRFPMVESDGSIEGGVSPGAEVGVFDCDFGRLGVLICWDLTYPEAWDALAAAGVEVVAIPSASPQTLRPAAEALRHHVYVVTSTPRDNASLFDPIGRVIAQVTERPGVLVHQLDLAYAILHWSETLENGHALQERFGDRVGFSYSAREDTGVFWSNDPGQSIGAMIREAGLQEMPVVVDHVRRVLEAKEPPQP